MRLQLKMSDMEKLYGCCCLVSWQLLCVFSGTLRVYVVRVWQWRKPTMHSSALGL